jgi:hypothetical protein
MLHHFGKVRAEEVLSDSLSEGANGVNTDSSKLDLLTLASESQELSNAVDSGWEIRQETLLGSMSGTTNGTGRNGFYTERSILEETSKSFHYELEILLNIVMKYLQ